MSTFGSRLLHLLYLHAKTIYFSFRIPVLPSGIILPAPIVNLLEGEIEVITLSFYN